MKQTDKFEFLNIDTSLYKTRLSARFRNRKQYSTPDHRLVCSFIPGTILDILVKPGQMVKKGDALMILDAMKMQNMLKSSTEGKIKKIAVSKGEKVAKGTVLIELK